MTIKYKDLRGQKFGQLTPIEYIGNKKWKCLCDCGKECVVYSYNLQKGQQSCGCLKLKRENLIGQKFGLLTVLDNAPDYIQPNGNKVKMCRCKCDCGKETIVRTGGLKNGTTKSCGCLRTNRKSQPNSYKFQDDCVIGYTSPYNHLFYIDKEDYEKIKQYHWYISSTGYVVAHIKKVLVSLHRFITNCPEDKMIDHINRNPLDNRKTNLRIVTAKENQENKKRYKNNISGTTGVSWHKQAQKWRARIYQNGKEISLGLFDTKEKAIEARLQAVKEYYTPIPDVKPISELKN